MLKAAGFRGEVVALAAFLPLHSGGKSTNPAIDTSKNSFTDASRFRCDWSKGVWTDDEGKLSPVQCDSKFVAASTKAFASGLSCLTAQLLCKPHAMQSC